MKKISKRIILLFITLIFLYFVLCNLDFKELLSVIKTFNLKYIPLLIISILSSLSLRGLIFKQLLAKNVKAPILELSHLCITTAAMNIILPARAGDIYRAFYIGSKYNTDKIKIFGTVMFERIFDIMVIFSFLLAGVFIYHRSLIAMKLCFFAGSSMLIGFFTALAAYHYNKKEKLKTDKNPLSGLIDKVIHFINNVFNSFLRGFEAVESPRCILGAIITSFAVWFLECMNFYIVMLGFNCNIHWSVTLFLISFIALACMIPSASIFIGPYQMAVISAFNLYNVNKETALAVSITEQSIVAITTAIAAIIFFVKNNISYKELQKNID